MKFILIIFFLISFNCFAGDCTSSCLYSINYDSAKYNVEITYCCEEGELECDNVYYKGTNKINKSFIYLKGKTINNTLSHSFLGYQFENNGYLYMIRDNLLSIYKDKKLLQENELYETE